uniref:Caveolin n=1 Tax=Heterorhabditis bacteriophora TaxID=37862 RepID=A0A1I7XGF7_HETBA
MNKTIHNIDYESEEDNGYYFPPFWYGMANVFLSLVFLTLAVLVVIILGAVMSGAWVASNSHAILMAVHRLFCVSFTYTETRVFTGSKLKVN